MAIYKEFERRRPPWTNVPDARFYLQVNRSKTQKSPGIWFKDQPMGKNTIGDIAKTMSNAANLVGKKTNHGGRRTALTKLVHSKIAPEYITQLSGHKNVASLNHYSTLSIDQQKEMSNILSGLQTPHISPLNAVPCEVEVGQVSFDRKQVQVPIVNEKGLDISQGFFPNMSIGFAGATIQNVKITYAAKRSPAQESRKKWKRIRVIDSQSSDEDA